MQTTYYSIEKPAAQGSGEGKVIDLAQYRRRLEGAQRRQEEDWEEVPVQHRSRSSANRARWGLFWDAVASLGVLVMTLTFCVQLLA